MNLYFIVDWYLNKMNDNKFKDIWERKYLKGARRTVSISFLLYLFTLIVLTNMVTGGTNWFLGLLFFFSFGFMFGVLVIFNYLRFMARQNMRYFQIMSGSNSDINYDNVVG